jgi:dihydrofolate reductase
MSVIATITTSVDGYVTGPDDGPGNGLGTGGERLHHWVMGGPWTYDTEHDTTGMVGVDREFFEAITAGLGACIVGRGMYEAAGGWGGTNPFPAPLFVLTHRTEDAPDPSSGFTFVGDLDSAMTQAAAVAGDGDVSIGGGADVIRQALTAGYVDELVLSTAPVVLGAGKALFDGFTQDLDLEVLQVWSSPYATHVRYGIRR